MCTCGGWGPVKLLVQLFSSAPAILVWWIKLLYYIIYIINYKLSALTSHLSCRCVTLRVYNFFLTQIYKIASQNKLKSRKKGARSKRVNLETRSYSIGKSINQCAASDTSGKQTASVSGGSITRSTFPPLPPERDRRGRLGRHASAMAPARKREALAVYLRSPFLSGPPRPRPRDEQPSQERQPPFPKIILTLQKKKKKNSLPYFPPPLFTLPKKRRYHGDASCVDE